MFLPHRLRRLPLSSSKPKLLLLASSLFSHPFSTRSNSPTFKAPRTTSSPPTSNSTTLRAPRTTSSPSTSKSTTLRTPRTTPSPTTSKSTTFLAPRTTSSPTPSKSTTLRAPRTTPPPPWITALIHTTTPPPDQEQPNPDGDSQISFPIEKLFIPPETDVPSETGTFRARILNGSNIVVGKYAEEGRIVSAEFVKSSVKIEQCPSDNLPEFAIVGRSNVGKSSLLNSIVRRSKLALTSKTPGKTRCINHFKIDDRWYLVDLPGYGYARISKDNRKEWDESTRHYFLNRPTLVSVFLLIDASIPATKIDLEYAQWLGQNQIPMTIIFTKCDKRKKKKNGGKRPEENIEDFQQLIRNFFQTPPPWIMSSSLTKQGRDEILLHISQLRNYWLKH